MKIIFTLLLILSVNLAISTIACGEICTVEITENMTLGWNLIGFQFKPNGITNAQSLVASIETTGIEVTHVASWTGSSWMIYQYGLPFNNFEIEVKGYMLRCTQAGIWSYFITVPSCIQPTPTVTPIPPTQTPSPLPDTPTPTPTESNTPSNTPTQTETLTPTTSPTGTPTAIPTQTPTPTSTPMSFFHTNGRRIISDTTREAYLFRGVNLDGLEWGNFGANPYPGALNSSYFAPSAQDLDIIKSYGCNVVRLPFEWARLVPGWTPGSPVTLDQTYLAHIDAVIEQCRQRGIYVVLDLHDFLKYWSGYNAQLCLDSNSVAVDTRYQDFLVSTWTALANHWKDNSAVLGYDIMNEPIREEGAEPCGSCNWDGIAQAIVIGIRTADTNHMIFVEGKNYSLASNWHRENPSGTFVTDPGPVKRMAYSPHMYFDFNNDSHFSGTGEGQSPIGLWQYYVRDRLLPVIQWAMDANVAIYLGETGVPCSQDWADALDWFFDEYLDPLHISVTLWHYANPPWKYSPDELNSAFCVGSLQLNIIQNHPKGPITWNPQLSLTPTDSVIYDGQRENPWEAGQGYWGSPSEIAVDFCAQNPTQSGSCCIKVDFYQSWPGLLFLHHFGFDPRWFSELRFWIYYTGTTAPEFRFYTKKPSSDCFPNQDEEYPPDAQRPRLSDYLTNPTPNTWQEVSVPLSEIVKSDWNAFYGIAFQNMGQQHSFYLKDIRLVQ